MGIRNIVFRWFFQCFKLMEISQNCLYLKLRLFHFQPLDRFPEFFFAFLYIREFLTRTNSLFHLTSSYCESAVVTLVSTTHVAHQSRAFSHTI